MLAAKVNVAWGVWSGIRCHSHIRLSSCGEICHASRRTVIIVCHVNVDPLPRIGACESARTATHLVKIA